MIRYKKIWLLAVTALSTCTATWSAEGIESTQSTESSSQVVLQKQPDQQATNFKETTESQTLETVEQFELEQPDEKRKVATTKLTKTVERNTSKSSGAETDNKHRKTATTFAESYPHITALRKLPIKLLDKLEEYLANCERKAAKECITSLSRWYSTPLTTQEPSTLASSSPAGTDCDEKETHNGIQLLEEIGQQFFSQTNSIRMAPASSKTGTPNKAPFERCKKGFKQLLVKELPPRYLQLVTEVTQIDDDSAVMTFDLTKDPHLRWASIKDTLGTGALGLAIASAAVLSQSNNQLMPLYFGPRIASYPVRYFAAGALALSACMRLWLSGNVESYHAEQSSASFTCSNKCKNIYTGYVPKAALNQAIANYRSATPLPERVTTLKASFEKLPSSPTVPLPL